MRRKRVDASIEEQILTCLIVSTDYCNRIIGNGNLNVITFMRAEHVRKLTNWVVAYYKNYGKAPGPHMEDLFYGQQKELQEAESEYMERFLAGISEKYESSDKLNIDYYIDQTYEYVRTNGLEDLLDTAYSNLLMGNVIEAERLVIGYNKVMEEISGWVKPFSDRDYREKTLNTDHKDLFRLPGAIGELIGTMRRKWLVGIMGPMKRGKTWWLEEFTIHGALSGFNAIHIILEDEEDEFSLRSYKRATGLADPGGGGRFAYPVFDCWRNKEGSCDMPQRKSKVSLMESDGYVPEFEDAPPDYVPCCYCRDRIKELRDFPNLGAEQRAEMRKLKKAYDHSSWFVSTQRQGLTLRALEETFEGMRYTYGVDNLWLKAYPSGTAKLSDIVADIDALEYQEGFIPDIITIDYADIIAPEFAGTDPVERTNQIWSGLKGLAQKRHCLVVTGSQSTRAGTEKTTLGMKDTPDNIKKLAHVNAMFTLNQTEEEQEAGVMRFGVLVHRHRKRAKGRQVMVLQQLELGQPNIDSEFVRVR